MSSQLSQTSPRNSKQQGKSRKEREKNYLLKSSHSDFEVLDPVLAAGDSVETIDSYRELFEKAGHALAASSHLRQFIPVPAQHQLEMEVAALHQSLDPNPHKKTIHEDLNKVVLIFDGTSHFGEDLLVIARFRNGIDWRQILLRLRRSELPLSVTILGTVLVKAMERYSISGVDVLAFVKDTPSTTLPFMPYKALMTTPHRRPQPRLLVAHLEPRRQKAGPAYCLPLYCRLICLFHQVYEGTSIKSRVPSHIVRVGPSGHSLMSPWAANLRPFTRSKIRWYNDRDITLQLLEFRMDKVKGFVSALGLVVPRMPRTTRRTIGLPSLLHLTRS